MDLSDPYLIAALRGGTVDVLRVAVISLVDRGLIKASDNKIRYPQSNRGESVTHPSGAASCSIILLRAMIRPG